MRRRSFGCALLALVAGTLSAAPASAVPYPSNPAWTADPSAGWHRLALLAGKLAQPDEPAVIRISAGFASVKDEGDAEVHCVSFQNAGAKTATRIAFTSTYFDAAAKPLASLDESVSGSFAPNADVEAAPDLKTYLQAKAGAGPPHSLIDGCRENHFSEPQARLLTAQFVTFRIVAITFADGTTWRR